MPLLAVDDLTVRFPVGSGRHAAVDGLTFELDAGGTLAVVGESGSGKTVAARAIMGLLPSTADVAGSIRLGDPPIELVGLPERRRREVYGRRVAMVPQDPATALNPVRTIGSQLAESLRFHLGLGRREARERSASLLARVEIPAPRDRLDRYPHELSGGMRQRVVIAMALSCEPELLVADEPTTALDVTVQRGVLDLLDRLRTETGLGLVLITHHLHLARERCERIVVMYAGRAAEVGPTPAVFADPRHPYTGALLGASPAASGHRRPLVPIPGRVPDLGDRPPGCHFAPRCAAARPSCAQVPARVDGAGDGRSWWCWSPQGAPGTAVEPAARDEAHGAPV